MAMEGSLPLGRALLPPMAAALFCDVDVTTAGRFVGDPGIGIGGNTALLALLAVVLRDWMMLFKDGRDC